MHSSSTDSPAGRIAQFIASGIARLVRLAPRTLPPAFAEEVHATVMEACDAAYVRGGWPALLATGVAETFDVTRCVARGRFGYGPRVTLEMTMVGSERRRRPLMFITDIRRAWRRLRARPSVALGAAAMLALGIGLTTSMFSLADSLLLRPVPFRDAGSLARLQLASKTGARYVMAPDLLRGFQQSDAFAAVQGATTDKSIVQTSAGPIERSSALVTPGLFDMLGVQPIRGRLFTADEGRGGADDRALISESVWRGVFGGDPSLVGRTIVIDGASATVVGILPDAFHFPRFDTTIWLPVNYDAPSPARGKRQTSVYVRFRPDGQHKDALAAATRIAHDVDASTTPLYVDAASMAGLRLDPYYQRAIPMLGGGVLLVFVVLCANASSLILAGFTARRREFGVCTALGASRGRILREAVVEAALIGAAGACGGLALAGGLVNLARHYVPDAFLVRTLNPLDLDGRAVAAAAFAGILAVLVAGVLPAWRVTRGDMNGAIRDVERGTTSSRTARRLMRGLLVGEVALACMLLAGSALLVRSFINLMSTNRGLDVSNVLTAWVSFPAPTFVDTPARLVATKNVEDALSALPTVEKIAFSFGVPPGGGYVRFMDPLQPGGKPLVIDSYDVTPQFFDLYGIPILRGRGFTASDTPKSTIVSEHLAALLWPGEDPLGRTFTHDQITYTVVGLARETVLPSLDPQQERPEFYQPFQAGSGQEMMSIRCRVSCPDTAVIRQRLLEAAPGANVVRVESAETNYLAQVAPPRAAAWLSIAFGAIAFFAAAGGLFSVLTYAVGKRQREFGIRAALGASPPQIRAVVIRDGLAVAAVGVAIGAGLSWLLGRALVSLQYGASIGDALTWIPPFVLVAAASLAAVWRPARRAMRVDPALLLRGE